MDKQLLNIKEVGAMVGFKETWIRERVKAGEFPQPIKLHGATRWKRDLIEEWLKGL